MPSSTSPDQAIDIRFTGPITTEQNSGWHCVVVPDSGELLGTRKAIKVSGTVDGHPVAVTLMPMGDGTHMVPLKAATRKALAKSLGDDVEVHLDQRLT